VLSFAILIIDGAQVVTKFGAFKVDIGMHRQTILLNLLQKPCKTPSAIVWQAEMWSFLPRKEHILFKGKYHSPHTPYRNHHRQNTPIENICYNSTSTGINGPGDRYYLQYT